MLVYWQHFVHEWQELQFAAVSVFNSSSSMVVIWRWTVAKFLTEVLFHWLVFWVLEYSYDTADWYACVCVHVCMYAAVCSVITSLCHDITMSCIQLRWHWVSWLHYLNTWRHYVMYSVEVTLSELVTLPGYWTLARCFTYNSRLLNVCNKISPVLLKNYCQCIVDTSLILWCFDANIFHHTETK